MEMASNIKLSMDKAVTTSEITIALDAADTVAATLISRIALDASDLNANDHSFADWQDYSLESMLDAGSTPAAPITTEVDPLAPYADQYVKLSYLIPGMALDIGTLYLGKHAHDKAVEFANNPKIKEKVGIFCATTGDKIMEVLPMVKGSRKAAATPRHTQTSKVDNRIVLTEEEKAWLADYDAAISEDKEREKARKALDAYYAKWHADYNAAVKANEKFDQERAARLAKIMKANRRCPEEGTDNFDIFKLFSEEYGLTCMEGNHAMNVLKSRNDSNYGWKQKGKEFAAKVEYNKVLIGTYRVCAVAYAKTGLTDKSMKEAMRLVDKSYDEAGNLVIPNGWYVIKA